MNELILGDSQAVLQTLPSDSVDLVVTDPPYGYSFMGKDWDKAVPTIELWKECLRVLKPGAFAFVMSAPRSDVQNAMISRMMEAGFRLDFTPIYWTYASGFPKAGNIGKMVDKRLGAEREVVGHRKTKAAIKMNGGNYVAQKNIEVVSTLPITDPATDQAKSLDGSYAGFQPKPAVEVILVAMKPLSEKTYVDQALKNKKGITWLDDVRVPTQTNEHHRPYQPTNNERSVYGAQVGFEPTNAQGRFPANLIVSDDVLNDGTISTSNRNERPSEAPGGNTWGGTIQTNRGARGHSDSGSYSRYFDLDAWAKTLPFLIVPKASKSEKNKGLDHMEEKEAPVNDFRPTLRSNPENWKTLIQDTPYGGANRGGKAQNNHPTVKPLKLMSYLITLGSRGGDTVLDPFCGSGTTLVAAKMLKRGYIGIERELEYVEIAQARLDAHEPELNLL